MCFVCLIVWQRVVYGGGEASYKIRNLLRYRETIASLYRPESELQQKNNLCGSCLKLQRLSFFSVVAVCLRVVNKTNDRKNEKIQNIYYSLTWLDWHFRNFVYCFFFLCVFTRNSRTEQWHGPRGFVFLSLDKDWLTFDARHWTDFNQGFRGPLPLLTKLEALLTFKM